MKRRDLIHLLAVSKTTSELGPRHASDKVHASLSVLHEEWVVLGNLDGEALWVKVEFVVGTAAIRLAALNPGSCTGESEEGGVGDVVVDKLTPLHHVVRVQLTGSINIGNNVWKRGSLLHIGY